MIAIAVVSVHAAVSPLARQGEVNYTVLTSGPTKVLWPLHAQGHWALDLQNPGGFYNIVSLVGTWKCSSKIRFSHAWANLCHSKLQEWPSSMEIATTVKGQSCSHCSRLQRCLMGTCGTELSPHPLLQHSRFPCIPPSHLSAAQIYSCSAKDGLLNPPPVQNISAHLSCECLPSPWPSAAHSTMPWLIPGTQSEKKKYLERALVFLVCSFWIWWAFLLAVELTFTANSID